MIPVADKYIGIPFETLTCWQLICHYYRCELGTELPGYKTEYRDADDHHRIDALYDREIAGAIWPPVANPQYPDLAGFAIAGWLWHVGLVLGDGCMLHTQRGCESVIETYTSARWKNRHRGFYRYAKLLE